MHRILHAICVASMLGFSIYEFRHLPINYGEMGKKLVEVVHATGKDQYTSIKVEASKLGITLP